MNKAGVSAGKFVLYILGKCLAIIIAAALIILCFLTAMDTMNVLVMTDDAFQKRTSVILSPLDNDDTALLSKIFTEEYLEESGLDTQQTNADYSITAYSERTDTNFALVFPWQDEMVMQVKNTVENISAKLINEANPNPVDSFIESGIYKVTLIREEGSWKVSDLELVEEITPDDVNPIPTPTPPEAPEETQEQDDLVDEEEAGSDNTAGDAPEET